MGSQEQIDRRDMLLVDTSQADTETECAVWLQSRFSGEADCTVWKVRATLRGISDD